MPHFSDDLTALTKLTHFKLPPLRVVRPSKAIHVFYGFVDASCKQFGQMQYHHYNFLSQLSDEYERPNRLRYRLGIWNADEQKESSNYKELHNLVEATEVDAAIGWLNNC